MAGKRLVTEFKEFVLRGNVIDLAVARVVAAAAVQPFLDALG
jgi:large-conductance mechanosensitive channel